jgi:predicted NAD/FAD-binding protein
VKSLAIIGTGIAGMACGYHLSRRFDLTVYEKNGYIGGHTHTVEVPEQNRQIPIDTGFIVYNETNYPELTRLFAELKVPTQATEMSFSVQHQPTGLEFCGTGWSGLFAQRKNIFNGSFWTLLKEIDRFNREAPEVLTHERYADSTLGEYAAEKKFSVEFLERYLIPMSSAVWSTPPDAMLRFPVVALVRFFKNHAFLGLHGQHAWRTVTGGSWQYRDRLIADFRDRVHTARPSVRVERHGEGVRITDAGGTTKEFDAVIIAAHADEALGLLAQPTPQEAQLLGAFGYQPNSVVLHTDERVMPRTRRAWSAWNYRYGANAQGVPQASTVYWMNRLQRVSQKKNYFVSVNDAGQIAPEHRLQEFTYEHPIFSVQAMRAQNQLPSLNIKGPIFFCGSYFRYGFHEDALASALQVVRRMENL